MTTRLSKTGRGHLRWIAAGLLLLLLFSIVPASAEPLEQTRHVFINVSNTDGVKFNLDGAAYGGPNNTYYIKADGGGLNELHITADADNAYGQVTTSSDQSGVFYVSNTGGRGFDDAIVLLLAVNGTVPDDFAVHVKTSGYTWTPSSVTNQVPMNYTYIEGAVNETFTKEDFLYGPQTWKPGPGKAEPYLPPGLPLYEYHDVTDTSNTFSLMFIDLDVGNMYPSKFSGATLTDNGGAKVEYSFENLETFASFNAYGWCLAANQGQGISWTNRVNAAGETAAGTSGYSVIGIPPVLTSIEVTPATTEVEIGTSMQFTATALDQNDRAMSDLTYEWSSNDETVGTVNATGYFTALAAGTTTIAAANDTVEGTATVTVTAAPSGPQPLSDYNNVFFKVANDAGVKYNAFGNNTYNVRFEGYDRGLNALHISTDPAVNFGQVTVSENQSGTFYGTDSGGKGYEDEILLMVAVNGTISDDFRLHITADGYTWTPNPVSNQPPSLDNVTYQPVSLSETFTKEDFRYGPQLWKPTGNGFDYPIHFGQNMSDTANTFQVMFIDLNAGVLRPNADLENRGAVRINYTVENLDTFAAFNVYAYCQNSNNGDDMIAWTNAVLAPKATSGYSVIGAGLAPSRIAVVPAAAALAVGDERQFTATAYDADSNEMTGITFSWSSSNETVGTVNATGYFMSLAAGTTTVTASYGAVEGTATVTVGDQSGGLAASAWPMYGHDLQHTGLSSATGPAIPEIAWTYKASSFFMVQPVVDADGTVYAGSRNKIFYALHPNGTLKWSYTAPQQIYSAAAIGSDGTVYFGCRYGMIYALNPNGTVKWTFTTGGDVSAAPAIGTDGTIYAGSADTKIYALNPDGTEKWNFTTGGSVTAAPAIGLDGTIYTGSADSSLYALNPDGTLKWSYATGGAVKYAPAIGSDGTIYTASAGCSLYAVNPDGTLKWSYATGGAVAPPAIGPDGTIYAGSASKTVNAVNPDGTLKWSYNTTGTVTEAPAVDARGTVYIPSTDRNDRYLYAIGSDGTLKWTLLDPVSPRFFYTPSIGADGTLYIGSSDSNIYAIEAAAPALVDITITPSSTTLAIGRTQLFTASGIDQYGDPVENITYSWTIDNETVGTIDSTGLFAALSEGNATITASSGGVEGNATVTVVAAPKEWYVDGNGSGNFTTIQAAIDGVQAGSTIIVMPGMYNETLNITKPLTLRSASGAAVTTIHISGGTAITVSSDSVTVDGFTIEGEGDKYTAGVIFNDGSHSFRVANTVVTKAKAAVCAYNSDNGVVENNSFTDGNYGVCLCGCSNVEVRNNFISDSWLMGITVSLGHGEVTPHDDIVSGNVIQNTTMGALHMDYASNCIVSNNTFYNNGFVREGVGCALYLARNVENNVFFGNSFIENERLSVDTNNLEFNRWNSDEAYTYTYSGSVYTSPIGNYWGGSFALDDTDSNGISNIPAQLYGTATDNYPLMQPVGRYFGIEDDLPIPTSVYAFGPESPSVPIGEFRQFVLSVNDQNGNKMTEGMASYWSSSDESVATIDADGVLTPLAEGTTVITGRCADIAVSTTVTVIPAEPGSKTFVVDENGSGDFATIQVAINAANAGDTLIVKDGTYVERVYVTKPLTIRSENGADTTTVVGAYDSTANTPAITISADNVTFEGFTVQMLWSKSGDSGLFVQAANCTLTNNTIKNLSYGINLYLAQSCLVTQNTLSGGYTGIRLYAADYCMISDNHLISVTLPRYIQKGMNNNTFVNNTVEDCGGAPVSVAVSPTAVSLAEGTNEPFSATAYDEEDFIIIGSPVTWSSSNTTVGTVDATGTFTARKVGTTTVSAAVGEIFGTAAVTVTPPHGDQTEDSPLNVPGCNITDNGNGTRQVLVNTTATNATVSGNTIRIDEDTFSLIIETTGAPTVGNGTVNGTVAGITLNTTPVSTIFDALGTVTASIEANLTGIPAGAAVQTTVSANVSADAQSAFQLAASKDGLNLDAVAYTLNIVKTNLTNGQDISDATIRMAVSQAWVDANGGVDAIKIIRSAEDGTTEVLATTYIGLDADGNMVFEAYSPNGLSIFGLAAASAVSPTPSGSSSSSGGSSSVASFSGSVSAGATKSFVVSQTAVKEITVIAKNDISDLLITVKAASLPSTIEAPVQATYQIQEIALYRADAAAIGSAMIEFAVPTSWLDARGLATGDIVLMRYVDGAWTALPTTFVEEKNGFAYFSAETPGFSYFAIAVEKSAGVGETAVATTAPAATATTPAPATTAPATAAPTQQSPLPWFAAFVALGAFLFLRRL
ncbi:parallel beta-helix repeat protein [Methanofollis liminatans DSM 4140]|uniref:Parallel beta-helix repeat protein n=1 Tax=Methanofollis liminatans DSM 4140 TaxID=28892 RepID=J1L4T8_9EURY|nr:PQQ-binding-like beta-propeller repeat protein [Methanofollis liminatans]EJG07785.1 parallel beta-helix repeat protein [Methanofollis liminatans DSM 4140]